VTCFPFSSPFVLQGLCDLLKPPPTETGSAQQQQQQLLEAAGAPQPTLAPVDVSTLPSVVAEKL